MLVSVRSITTEKLIQLKPVKKINNDEHIKKNLCRVLEFQQYYIDCQKLFGFYEVKLQDSTIPLNQNKRNT